MTPGIQEFLRLVSLLVATPVVFYSGAPFFAGAWRGLRNRRPGMDLPVSLAIAAAYVASAWSAFTGSGDIYFDSAVMFVFFLSAARFLEMSGRHRAPGMTDALARPLPKVAMRLTGGHPEPVGVMELQAGDLVLVHPSAVISRILGMDTSSPRGAARGPSSQLHAAQSRLTTAHGSHGRVREFPPATPPAARRPRP